MRGWTSLTTIVTDAVSVPPVFVAVTVYDAEAVTVVGVPEIAPVEATPPQEFQLPELAVEVAVDTRVPSTPPQESQERYVSNLQNAQEQIGAPQAPPPTEGSLILIPVGWLRIPETASADIPR